MKREAEEYRTAVDMFKGAKGDRPKRRAVFAMQLASEKSPEALPFLKEMLEFELKNDKNLDVKKQILLSAGKIQHPDALEILRMLASDPDVTIKWHVADELAKRKKDPAAVSLLEEMLHKEKSFLVKRRILEALGQIL